MTSNKHLLWVEHYRPQRITNYVFHDETHQRAFERMIGDQTIPHLLLSGTAGSGKTTLAQILVTELNVDPTDVLTINASDENSVDVMRDKIRNFVTTFAIGAFKIVHLEEADYISGPGQAILRRLMEEYHDNVRFVLTCNYENKILPAIKSRCQHFRFKAPDRDKVTEFAAVILIEEHVAFDLDILDKYVSVGYPDVRKIINLLQQNTSEGVLFPLTGEGESGDYKFKLLEYLESNDLASARQLVCANVLTEEWDELYTFLYTNLDTLPKFKVLANWESGIVVIADHLHKHSMVSDPAINAAAMFIRLGQI